MPKNVYVGPGDLARTVSREADQTWPDGGVEIRLHWNIGDDETAFRTHHVSADEFFGRGDCGAPISGDALIQAIDRLRRLGSPVPPQQPQKRR